MMVSSIQAASDTTNAVGSKKFNQITSLDFLNLMVKELQHQDPFQPFSSKEMLQQVGQLRNLESSLELMRVLKELAADQQLGSAGALLGKLVTGLTDSGESVTGVVSSVRIERDEIYLELDTGERLALKNVTQINQVASQ